MLRVSTIALNLEKWLEAHSPWTPIYGLARSVLALGTALTLLFNHTDTLFLLGAGISERVLCSSMSALSLYCLVPLDQLEVARFVSIAGLALVISGWRPRVTALLHLYLSYSLHASALLVDGGEQVTTVLTVLLLPIALTDGRRSHWEQKEMKGRVYAGLVAHSALIAIRVQVAIIYLVAGAAKMGVAEWVDGTALYYWLRSPFIGVPPGSILENLFAPLLETGLVALATWGVIAFEFLLAGALFMSQPYRRLLIVPALLFHGAIAIFMGISSFSIAMTGALILYLLPTVDNTPASAHSEGTDSVTKDNEALLVSGASASNSQATGRNVNG